MSDELNQLKALKTSYKKCFETDDGKKVLADLKKRCFYNDTTLYSDLTGLQMAFNEGTRSVVLDIESMSDLSTIKEDKDAGSETR